MKKNVKRVAVALTVMLLCMVSALTVQAAGLNKKTLSLYEGQTYTLKGVGEKAASFKSSNSKVASVNSKTGLVTGKKAGTCTIQAKVGTKVYSCKVTVKKSVELIKHIGSYADFKKAVGYMRQAGRNEEPLSYTGTLYFGSGANVSNGNFFIRTNKPGGKVVSLQNKTKKQFTLFGVRLGDSYTNALSQLKKNDFKLKRALTYNYGDYKAYREYSNGRDNMEIWITKNTKIGSYRWYRK